jgi:transcriptional regulator with XRE-family HTH domain
MSTDLKLLRQQFGLTAQQLADIIGCSRSVISLAEIGERQLPANAQQALGQLQSLQNTSQAKKAGAASSFKTALWPVATQTAALQKLRKTRARALTGKQQTLEILQERLEKAKTLENLALALSENAPVNSEAQLVATIAYRKAAQKRVALQWRTAMQAIMVASLTAQVAAIDALDPF